MSKPDRPCVQCSLIHETEKAWLVDDGKTRVWVPKSQAELYDNNDHTYNLFLEEWLAKEKGLI